MDGIFGIEQGLDLDESTFEQAQGWFKRATAGAHDGDLVDDEGDHRDLLGAVKRGFQHQRAARPQQCVRKREAPGLTATIDDDIEAAIMLSRCVQRANAAPAYEREFAGMTTEDLYMAARQLEDLRHEYAELTVADDRHTLTRPDMDAVGDLQRRRQRLDEHRLCIAYRIGHAMEIAWQEASDTRPWRRPA